MEEYTDEEQIAETAPNNGREKRTFTQAQKEQCWQRAKVVPGRDPARWRLDAVGNVVSKNLRGCAGCFCHEYDHIVPFSQGGKTEVSNCQILQTRVNRMKGARTDLTYEDMRKFSCDLIFSERELDMLEMALYGGVNKPGAISKVKSIGEHKKYQNNQTTTPAPAPASAQENAQRPKVDITNFSPSWEHK